MADNVTNFDDIEEVLSVIRDLSTGWKHGTEGERLLNINAIACKSLEAFFKEPDLYEGDGVFADNH